jgi:hypothetical protein
MASSVEFQLLNLMTFSASILCRENHKTQLFLDDSVKTEILGHGAPCPYIDGRMVLFRVSPPSRGHDLWSNVFSLCLRGEKVLFRLRAHAMRPYKDILQFGIHSHYFFVLFVSSCLCG